MKTKTRLISILLATMMVLSMSAAMFSVSATADDITLNFSAGANGTLTAVDSTSAPVTSGDKFDSDDAEVITFTAAPASGYEVDAWSGVTGSGNTASITLDTAGTVTVSVTFKAISTPGGEFSLKVWYDDETIQIVPDSGSISGIEFYYAIKLKDDTEATIAKAKWFPLYGDEFDISKYIPKKLGEGKQYVIAVKEIASGDIETVSIAARADIKDDKKSIIHNGTAFTFASGKTPTAATKIFEVKLSDSTELFELDKDNATKAAELDLFPAGAAFAFRIQATSDIPASAWAKGKVKAQAKAPKFDATDASKNVAEKKLGTDTEKSKIIKGLKVGMEIIGVGQTATEALANAGGGSTLPLTITDANKEYKLSDLPSLFTSAPTSGDIYVVIRTKATEAKPASAKAVAKFVAADIY